MDTLELISIQLAGLAVIRAFGQQDNFEKRLQHSVNFECVSEMTPVSLTFASKRISSQCVSLAFARITCSQSACRSRYNGKLACGA